MPSDIDNAADGITLRVKLGVLREILEDHSGGREVRAIQTLNRQYLVFSEPQPNVSEVYIVPTDIKPDNGNTVAHGRVFNHPDNRPNGQPGMTGRIQTFELSDGTFYTPVPGYISPRVPRDVRVKPRLVPSG